jgi:hypothetical protein
VKKKKNWWRGNRKQGGLVSQTFEKESRSPQFWLSTRRNRIKQLDVKIEAPLRNKKLNLNPFFSLRWRSVAEN